LDELFDRHPDVIKRLGVDAPSLLPTLLNGLVWRSKHVQNGQRRVNYYVQHLVVDRKSGHFSDALESIVESMDSTIINHPVVVLVADLFWTGIVRNQFLTGELGFIMGLITFMFGESILPRVHLNNPSDPVRISVMVFRFAVYFVTTPQFIFEHGKQIVTDIRKKETTPSPFLKIPIPDCLCEPHNMSRFLLTILLVLMLLHEPMFWCGFESFLDHQLCLSPAIERSFLLSSCSAVLFWLLLVNLAIFSTSLSAFMIVAVRMSTEIARFLAGLALLFLAFGCGACTLVHTNPNFKNITSSVVTLAAVTLGMYEPDYADLLFKAPSLLGLILFFMFLSMIFMLNLLIAQLNCSYEFISKDMTGLARLRCAALIVRNLEICTEARWQKFLATLDLDKNLELNEGDMGPASGIQVYEPANATASADELDNIHRFGGSTSPDLPWAEDTDASNLIEDRLDSLEQLCKKIAKKVSERKKKKAGAAGAGGTELTGSHHDDSEEDEDE